MNLLLLLALVQQGGAAARFDVEQRSPGERPPAVLVTSFDGLGVGFEGPHGGWAGRNPSDNSLAVGPNHIFQIVNTRMAIFNKKGEVLYGAVPTNTLFKGFGGACELRNNGDAVVRYDQLAQRWLVVMPVFRRGPKRPDQPADWQARATAYLSPPGVAGQPGPAVALFVPPPAPPGEVQRPDTTRRPPSPAEPVDSGPYSMCYAVSATADPLGAYYRYEFLRPLFPDYPRPAVWPDGYYVPTSTGDEVIQKHTCAVDRRRLLAGEPATEQCFVVDSVNFLNNADLDGTTLPPAGAPNIVLAAGGRQLVGDFEDDGMYVWQFHVDWDTPAKSRLTGPSKITVAPYHYLCDGQLTNCVRQPGTDRHLDAQGDKLMARVVYRNVGGREAVVAVHSVATAAGGGGVRWYEFNVAKDRSVGLRQQGTYAPDALYRWMASPAIDARGNIGIGYSFGGTSAWGPVPSALSDKVLPPRAGFNSRARFDAHRSTRHVSPAMRTTNPPTLGAAQWPRDAYRREAQVERILQFGTGVLLRALCAATVDAANRAGREAGRIVVVQSTEGGNARTMNAQDGLFTLVERGLVDGTAVDRTTLIGSISRAFVADDDWDRVVVELGSLPQIRAIVSNVTETGFKLDSRFPMRLAHLLHKRFTARVDSAPFFVVPTELVPDNGPRLAEMVEYHARRLRDAAFHRWLARQVRFCSSLVDRITTSAPGDGRLGYTDGLVTVTEPHCLWAIEGDPEELRAALPIDQPSHIVFAPDISFYRDRKLYLLNGAHTATAPVAILAGVPTVREATEHPRLAAFMRRALFDEIVPATPLPRETAAAFAETVWERFRNPWLEHAWKTIANGQTDKWALRVAPTIARFTAARGTVPEGLTLAHAASLKLTGEGTSDDPAVTRWRRLIDDAGIDAALDTLARMPA